MHIFGELLLFVTALVVLGAGLLLTVRTRFIQFRKIPYMVRLFFSLVFRGSRGQEGEKTVPSHKALFTAMSTTIGLSTIVSPFIAIRLGGPGALIGFFLATLLGAAVNFTEVTFALFYRKRHAEHGVAGGPMQYLYDEVGPFCAKWYAFFAFLMLLGWSAAQANQLGTILSSSALLGSYAVPAWITGILLAVSIIAILWGGIKRVANISAKLVPAMFISYVCGSLWIIFLNIHKLPGLFSMVCHSACTPLSFSTGITVGGVVAALRWGVCKGLHSNEAGVGTQTIPHSMAETQGAVDQGILSMVTTYSAGFVCMLSCLLALVTETWLDPTLPLGITMVATSFQHYFSAVGFFIVTISAFLFAFGTILGNSFNGSHCFGYLTKHRYMSIYYVMTALLIFLGTLLDVTFVWSFVDFLLVPVVVPHILTIVYLSYKQRALLMEPAQILSTN